MSRAHPTTSTHAKLAILIEIGRRGGKVPVNTTTMAAAAGISVSHLEVACAWLRRRRLIKSILGPHGGYVLARPASDILVADIIDSIKGGFGTKYRGADAATSATIVDLWDQSESLLMQVYQHITLAEVLRGNMKAHPILKKLRNSCQQAK